MAKKAFASKPADLVRSDKKLICWTPEESATVARNASLRKVSFGEFVRMAALGQKVPDVDYATDIIIELSAIVRSLRALHAALVEQGVAPPGADMLALIHDARAAMLRVEPA